MKYTVAVRSYQAAKELEGWVRKGEVFCVDRQHKPGLRVITARRAQELVQIRLHQEHVEGDTLPAADEIATQVRKQQVAERRTAPPRKTAVQPPAKRAVEPPPERKAPAPSGPITSDSLRRTAQTPNPPAPAQVRGGRRRAASQPATSETSQTSPAGGQTGAVGSPSSSAAAPASEKSTGTRRGLRRGDPELTKRQRSSRSTPASDSSTGPSASTPPTSGGGASTTEPEVSKG